MDTVRSLVQPITHNLPAPIRDLGVSIVGETCYKALLLDVDVENTECVKLAVSKGLGIGIVGASAVVKVPQILKLLKSKSAEGVSFLSYLLETSAYLISLAYNVRNGFPFSTFGETAFIMGQNVVISILVLNYSGRPAMAALFVAALAIGAAALFADNVVDMQALSYLQAGAGVLGVASKVPQILAIWQEGGTGQLSAFAVFNYLAGSLSRIFTTLQEVDDKLILYGFISGFALNAILSLQMVYYWNAPSAKARGKRKEVVPVEARGSSTAVPKKGPTTRRRDRNAASIGPANAANPDSPPRALQAALLLAEVAHRAAEADVLAAGTTGRVLGGIAAVHVHLVGVAPARNEGAAAVVALGRQQHGGRLDAGRRAGRAGLGANGPEAVQRLLAVRRRRNDGLLRRGSNRGFVWRELLGPLLSRVQQAQGVLCGRAR
ncbi:hypothetical protein MKX08_009085 [Trichoderma sp. CBMAI-0020]|nr:hypothetical protein MKX08_009085 [Trichoderma sp. CBMAI-0020]